MSVDTNIFVRRASMLSPDAWQAAVDELAFPLRMDTDFEVDEFEGFLPCDLEGEEAGFEFFAEDVDLDEFMAEGHLTSEQRNALGDRSLLITLSTRSSFRDGLAAVFAGAALCAKADGLLSCEGEPFVAAADALAWARSVEPGMRTGILEQVAREKRRQARGDGPN